MELLLSVPTTSWEGLSAEEWWGQAIQQDRRFHSVLSHLHEADVTLFRRNAGFSWPTLSQFWISRPELLRSLCAIEQPYRDVCLQVTQFVDSALEKFPQLHMISDNPPTDFVALEALIRATGTRSKISYRDEDHYTFVKNVRDMAEGFMRGRGGHPSYQAFVKYAGLETLRPRDHNPLEDARFVNRVYMALLKPSRRTSDSSTATR
jgi:hypothetical protein